MENVARGFWARLWDRIKPQLSGKKIFVYGKPYLTRYYLWGNGSGRGYELYLHNMHDIDKFRWLHNHPWPWFLSIVLVHRYEQETYETTQKVRRHETIRWMNFFRSTTRYHSIRELPKGSAWTLVLVPPKAQNYQWGYWNHETETHVPDDLVGHESARVVEFGPKKLLD